MKKREASLDIFRGITVAAMILVNTPGSWQHIYGPLKHAQWHGMTPTDLIFPFFLFAVGNSIFYTFKNSSLNLVSTTKIIKRSVLLFLFGVLLNAYPFVNEFSNLRIMGVLQRIALCYLVVSILVMTFKPRVLSIVSIISLAVYSVILFSFGSDLSVGNNLIGKVDIAILGSTHLYQGFGTPFDPEGLLSTVPSIVTTLFGYLVARNLDTEKTIERKLRTLLQLSFLILVAGLVTAFIIPINKPLWTASYVLITGSLASLLLSFIIWFVERRKKQHTLQWALIYGSNPLFIYILSWLYAATLSSVIRFEFNGQMTSLYQWCFELFDSFLPEKLASLLFALIAVSIFYLMSLYLYRKRIFIKI